MKWLKAIQSRMLLSALTLVVSAGVVAGCGGTKTDGTAASTDSKGGSEKENVELRFSWWGSQQRHDLTIKMIEKFQQLHPNIKIKPEYSAFGTYHDKLATQVAGSNAPDLISISIIYLKEYADRGVLMDLKNLAGKDIKVDGLDQNLLANQATVNGKLVGLPLSKSGSVMFYNKEMYKQAGVEPPKMDMTYDEFFDKAREMKGKLGKDKYGANDMSGLFEAFMYYLFSKGDVLFKDNKLGYKDENFKAWLEMWDKARKEGIVPPASETSSYQLATYDPNKEPILKGTVAMEGPLFVPYFPSMDGVLKDKLEMTTMPRADVSKKTASVLLPGIFFSMNAKTKHPKEAAMFMDFMINSAEAADILGTERGLPDNKKMVEYLKPKFTPLENKMQDVLEHIGKNDPGWYDGGPKGAGEVGKLFEQTVQKQQFGKATIDEVVAEFRKEANKVFEKNN
ncbi:ABC transporter substrate-binding protein [Paenibacillus sp. MBLB4367]|uniref:ABC transporter substrate-binding protein n=1 Tax=Paenibacillus sp. MBLB4367 TaxID=3384767 RepID=UPI003907EB94